MKQIKRTTLILGLLLLGCNQAETQTTSTIREKAPGLTVDKEQIQNLIRQVLNWAESKNSIDLLPTLSDSKDKIYVSFNLEKHRENLEKLKKTNFFSAEFIDNYNKIILTLDKGLKNGEYKQWLVGDLPSFAFANDVNPWCLCQDVPFDKPNPWDFIEVSIVKLDNEKGDAVWKWGKLELNTDPGWKDFSYKFRVVKENNRWKIAYLTGFDFKESTRKD
jgi:hypothetical protein